MGGKERNNTDENRQVKEKNDLTNERTNEQTKEQKRSKRRTHTLRDEGRVGLRIAVVQEVVVDSF
jgi:hypothetical protein